MQIITENFSLSQIIYNVKKIFGINLIAFNKNYNTYSQPTQSNTTTSGYSVPNVNQTNNTIQVPVLNNPYQTTQNNLQINDLAAILGVPTNQTTTQGIIQNNQPPLNPYNSTGNNSQILQTNQSNYPQNTQITPNSLNNFNTTTPVQNNLFQQAQTGQNTTFNFPTTPQNNLFNFPQSNQPIKNTTFNIPQPNTQPTVNSPFGLPQTTTQPTQLIPNSPFGLPQQTTQPIPNSPFNIPQTFQPNINQFGTPNTSNQQFNLDQYFQSNPNLSKDEKDNLTEVYILNKAGFFGGSNQNNGQIQIQNQTTFYIKPEDLLTPIEMEVPNALRLQHTIEFRKGQHPNELNNYASEIGTVNVESNKYIEQSYKAFQNLQQIQSVLNTLNAQIRTATNINQSNALNAQISTQLQHKNAQLNFIKIALDTAINNRKTVEHRIGIIRQIVGQNQFGNPDYDNSTRAAYDAILAEKRISDFYQQANNLFNTDQNIPNNPIIPTPNNALNPNINLSCLQKTGNKFYKTNPDSIFNNLVNFPTKTGNKNYNLIKNSSNFK